MTIITAISDGSKVWTGNNSAFTIGDTPITAFFDPWVRFGNWALGVTGDSFQQDFLTLHSEKLSKHKQSQYDLIDNIRHLFLEGYISKSSETHASASFEIWCILLHKDGRMWDVDNHLALAQIQKTKVWARGSGLDYALGADFAVMELDENISIPERIRICTQAAIKNDIGCPGEPVIKQFI